MYTKDMFSLQLQNRAATAASRCYCTFWTFILVISSIRFISLPTVTTEAVEAPAKNSNQLQYCSFFANRAPKIQLGLRNCTWFKENSCCAQKEIDAIFGKVKPLRGASPACQRYTNYLMCYICAPNQNTFYMLERLTVCEEFCDAWFQACQTAILKGSIIKQLYSNGSEFCSSRRFRTDSLYNKKCFFFDAKFDKSLANKLTNAGNLWIFILLSVILTRLHSV